MQLRSPRGLVACEVVLVLLGRRKTRAIPYTFQFDPYTFRYEKVWLANGMKDYDVEQALTRIQDRSSLIPLVVKFLYKKKKTPKIKVAGTTIHYEIGGSGDTVLLVNPLGADSSIWTRQVEYLSKYFRVITYDSIDEASKNDPHPNGSTQGTAKLLVGFLEQLGVQRVHLVGLALGGLIVQHMAAISPALCDRVVLVSAYIKANERIRATVAGWQKVAREDGMEELFDVSLQSLFSTSYLAENGEEVDKLKTFFRLNLQSPDRFVLESMSGVTHDSTAVLRQIRQSVLVIHGQHDAIVDQLLAEQLASALAHGELRVHESAGHFINWEQADWLNEEIFKFLVKSDSVRGGASAETADVRKFAQLPIR